MSFDGGPSHNEQVDSSESLGQAESLLSKMSKEDWQKAGEKMNQISFSIPSTGPVYDRPIVRADNEETDRKEVAFSIPSTGPVYDRPIVRN